MFVAVDIVLKQLCIILFHCGIVDNIKIKNSTLKDYFKNIKSINKLKLNSIIIYTAVNKKKCKIVYIKIYENY